MADYDVEIGGEHSLKDINQQIAGEEAGASEFLRSRVTASPAATSNCATFKELDPGSVPKRLTLVLAGTAAPTSARLIWSGQMVVTGAIQNVEAHRAN